MPPQPTTLLLALVFAATASTATASTHRTLNLLRGSEVDNGAELVMGEEWVVNNSAGVPIFVARNAPASNGNSVGVQYFSGQSRHPMEVSLS